MNRVFVAFVFLAALSASALNAQTIVLSPSMVDPDADRNITLSPGDSSSFYLWIDPLDDQKITGVGIDIVSSEPSVLEATNHTIFNPSFFGGALNRWDAAPAGTLGDLVLNSNAVAVLGQGIADSNTAFGDAIVNGYFLHSQIDFLATADGTSTVSISSNILGVADSDGLVEPTFVGGTVNVASVPEPTGTAFIAGSLALAFIRRRRS